jgi:hypothetical protein
LAVSYQGVGTLTGGNGGCDGVIEQAALPQKRRLSSLGDIRDQSVQQGAHPPDDLVLPGAEGPDLVEGELDEILPGRNRVHQPDCAVAVGDDPGGQKCFAAA